MTDNHPEKDIPMPPAIDQQTLEVVNFIYKVMTLTAKTGGNEITDQAVERLALKQDATILYEKLEAMKWGGPVANTSPAPAELPNAFYNAGMDEIDFLTIDKIAVVHPGDDFHGVQKDPDGNVIGLKVYNPLGFAQYLAQQPLSSIQGNAPADGERASALKALKALVYGGGNIGRDGKYDGGHRLVKGQISYDDWTTIIAALSQPVTVPAGWKLVPEEPTDEMLDIVASIPDKVRFAETMKIAKFERKRAAETYERMLSAAPNQPTTQEDEL